MHLPIKSPCLVQELPVRKKMMSYPFHVQFVRRGWRGRGGGGSRSGPGHIGLLYVIYPNFQDFLFDFLKRFQETEPFHFTEALQLFITQRHFCNSFPAIKVSN